MLVGKNKVNLPDECPKDCPYYNDISNYGQGAICRSCPLFVCTGERDYVLVSAEEFRDDWAVEWKEFFDTGMKKMPHLKLSNK